ncbi:unnamed protein product [Gongylonema pulchrum]|uniref:Reverse transcriptase domain-containing protein n=1 Tax=Gongylonema pulchrum TaxID=637853 RepID=A0A183E5C2_9BILA|nr:unnamed protein product [Gongylonema pulchrum]
MIAIFKDNRELCQNVTEELIAHIVNMIEHKARSAVFIEFLQSIVIVHEKEIESTQEKTAQEICSASDDVRVFYADSASFEQLVKLMQDTRPEELNADHSLRYHIELVRLLALCTRGRNSTTELKCASQLSMDHIVRVVTSPYCLVESPNISRTSFVPVVTPSEVETAIRSMKLNKAAGLDSVRVEELKSEGETIKKKALSTIYPGSHTEFTFNNDLILTEVKRSVKESDICSPKAFNSALEGVFGSVDAADGINIDGAKLRMLLFAEGVVLVAENPQLLQNLLNELVAKINKVGLTVNIDKTKTYCPQFDMKLYNSIGLVDRYTYLGQAVQMNSDLDIEITRWIRPEWILSPSSAIYFATKKLPYLQKQQFLIRSYYQLCYTDVKHGILRLLKKEN